MKDIPNEVLETLDNIAKISFGIYDIYENLSELEISKGFNPNYDEIKKRLLIKLKALKFLEETKYQFFRQNPNYLLDAKEYFNDRCQNDFDDNYLKDFLEFISEEDFEDLESDQAIKEDEDDDELDDEIDSIFVRIDYRLEDLILEQVINTGNFELLSSYLGYNNSLLEHFPNFIKLINNSFGFRKASFYLAGSKTTDYEMKKSLISQLFKDSFANNELENELIKNSFERIPNNLDEEINIALPNISDSERSRIIDDYFEYDIKRVIYDLSNDQDFYFQLQDLILFKTMLLYLSKDKIDDIKKQINEANFKNLSLKETVLIAIEKNDIVKRIHNKDSKFNKNMN